MTDALRKADIHPVIRPVVDSDGQDLFGLIALCYADYPGCFVDPHDDLPDLHAPGSSYAATNGGFWAIEDERGRVCACVAVDLPEEGTGELHRLYVRPDRRGRGFGSALVRQAEAHARTAGAGRMILWSDTRFTTAHRLYGRLGYLQLPGQRELSDISRSAEYGFERNL
jgi:putative acetyltransferase